jgi:O-antigen/teichoic acid export membrane protein
MVSIGGLVIRRYGRPAAIILKQDLGFGLASLMLQFSAVLQANVDRLILAREASMAAVAIYSAATRVTSFGTVPMQGMLRNLISGAFVAGSGGTRKALAYALRNSLRVLALGLLTALGVCVVAPVLPYVFGEAYRPSVMFAMALSLLPGLQGVQYLLADALSTTDHQFMRAAIACLATTFLIVLLVLLVRHIGLPGMVIGLYSFQIVAIAAFSTVLWHLGRREAAQEAGGQQA